MQDFLGQPDPQDNPDQPDHRVLSVGLDLPDLRELQEAPDQPDQPDLRAGPELRVQQVPSVCQDHLDKVNKGPLVYQVFLDQPDQLGLWVNQDRQDKQDPWVHQASLEVLVLRESQEQQEPQEPVDQQVLQDFPVILVSPDPQVQAERPGPPELLVILDLLDFLDSPEHPE